MSEQNRDAVAEILELRHALEHVIECGSCDDCVRLGNSALQGAGRADFLEQADDSPPVVNRDLRAAMEAALNTDLYYPRLDAVKADRERKASAVPEPENVERQLAAKMARYLCDAAWEGRVSFSDAYGEVFRNMNDLAGVAALGLAPFVLAEAERMVAEAVQAERDRCYEIVKRYRCDDILGGSEILDEIEGDTDA